MNKEALARLGAREILANALGMSDFGDDFKVRDFSKKHVFTEFPVETFEILTPPTSMDCITMAGFFAGVGPGAYVRIIGPQLYRAGGELRNCDASAVFIDKDEIIVHDMMDSRVCPSESLFREVYGNDPLTIEYAVMDADGTVVEVGSLD